MRLRGGAIVRVTSSGLCGSDLHLYEVLAPFMTAGDILGHEPMGVVEAVGSEVTNIAVGDRVVVPFNIKPTLARGDGGEVVPLTDEEAARFLFKS